MIEDNPSLVVKNYCSLLSEKQTEMFIIDLRREDKLNEFLNIVLGNIEEDYLTSEFICLTNEIWEDYILIQDYDYSFEETLEFA
jgi:hypothetical protein